MNMYRKILNALTDLVPHCASCRRNSNETNILEETHCFKVYSSARPEDGVLGALRLVQLCGTAKSNTHIQGCYIFVSVQFFRIERRSQTSENSLVSAKKSYITSSLHLVLCCSVLQCAAVCCSVRQCVVGCCSAITGEKSVTVYCIHFKLLSIELLYTTVAPGVLPI